MASKSLRDKAIAALSKPRFKELVAMIPKEERESPAHILAWLTVAAEFDPKGASSKEYKEAYTALEGLHQQQRLEYEAARLYHDPAIRREFTAEQIDRAWRDPEWAKDQLLNLSVARKLGEAGQQALHTLYEARQFSEEYGEAGMTDAEAFAEMMRPFSPEELAELPPEQPRDERGRFTQAKVAQADRDEAERKALIDKSIRHKLTPAEEQRMVQLFQAKVDAQPAPDWSKPQKSEFDRLIDKSFNRTITQAENDRLLQLAQAKADTEQSASNAAWSVGNYNSTSTDGDHDE